MTNPSRVISSSDTLGFDKTYEQETHCPYCERRHDLHSGPSKLTPGALAVCIDCGEVAVFTDALTLRRMTNAEWLALEPRLRGWLSRVRTHIRERDPTTR